jgi:hypothetical protein
MPLNPEISRLGQKLLVQDVEKDQEIGRLRSWKYTARVRVPVMIGSENLLSSLHGRVFSSWYGQSSLFCICLFLTSLLLAHSAPLFGTSYGRYLKDGTTLSHCAFSRLIKQHAVQHCAASPADPKLLQRPNSGWGSKIGYGTLPSHQLFLSNTFFIWYWLSLSNSLIFQKIAKYCIFSKNAANTVQMNTYKWGQAP